MKISDLRPPTAKTLSPDTVEQKSLDSSRKIHARLVPLMNPWQEEVWLLALNNELQPVSQTLVFRGTAESCPVHPRDIFRILILSNASCFVLAHNHPSDNARPSSRDDAFTSRLQKLALLMEIPMLDHLVICEKLYFSYADAGKLNGKSRRSRSDPRA